MEKLISLAQVEQLIDEMIEKLRWTPIAEYMGNPAYHTLPAQIKILEELKSKLSSLPTHERSELHGWIALDSLKMEDGERLYIRREGEKYLCNIEGNTGYGFCPLSLGEAISKLSIKPLPKPPIQ